MAKRRTGTTIKVSGPGTAAVLTALTRREPEINLDAPPPAGCVFIDIVEGVEGPSVSIGDNHTGYRVAGPKPWGGGKTLRRFTATLEDIKRAIESRSTGASES